MRDDFTDFFLARALCKNQDFPDLKPRTVLGTVVDKVSFSDALRPSDRSRCELLTVESSEDGSLLYIQLPTEASSEVRIEDELLIHNFVEIPTENGRKILSYGHNSTIAKTLAKPANMTELAVKSIHSQIEEIVRSSFKIRMIGGEVEYIYQYIEETKSYYVRVILPSLLLDEARSIYNEVTKRLQMATPDALISDGGGEGRFKIAFLIGKFPKKKEVAINSLSFRFRANYPDVFESGEVRNYE